MDGVSSPAKVTDDARTRAARLRMLRYLSEPPLPFLPEDGAA